MSHLYDVTSQLWGELISRQSGPLALRFLVQAGVAAVLAVEDGVWDARANRLSYLRSIFADRRRQFDRMNDLGGMIARMVVFSLAMDLLFQVTAFGGVDAFAALAVMIVFALSPYLIVRAVTERVVRAAKFRNKARRETQALRFG